MKTEGKTIRVKLILSIFASVGMAGISMLFLCFLMIVGSLSRQFALFFASHVVEFTLSFLLIFLVLTIAFFLWLIRNNILYLEEIIKTLGVISKGDLDINIPIRTNDELGVMAETVNHMAYRLKGMIEEERRMEKTKNDLVTNVSHDLRTPLTSILGYLELIKDGKYDSEESLRRYSSIAYSKCKELKVLIDDLFEYAKLNNSGITMNKTRLNIRELLEQVMLGFIPALEEAEMEYRLSLGNEKLMVEGDPVLLTRVFDNLVNNAIQHGKEGKYLNIELNKENDEAVIRVINYGEVISDADLPYVFEKFYQTDKSRSRQNGGAGLGLAIVKSIVEMHDGTISVNNSDNRTAFEVRLKLHVTTSLS